MRLSAGVNYVLRLMRTYTDLVGGDPTTALVFIAAAQACTQHVKVRPEALQEETFIRDEMRRPVSLSALARSLGLPVETTRRQVRRLIVLNDAGRLAGMTPPAWVFLSSPHVPLSSTQLRAKRESRPAS